LGPGAHPCAFVGKIGKKGLTHTIKTDDTLVAGALWLIGLFLATRSLEWFSSPKRFDPERQDRAVALSCYLCAPVLIITLAGGIASLATILSLQAEYMRTSLAVVSLAWMAVFLVWWPMATRGIHFTTGRCAKRTAVTAIALPLIWFVQQLLVVIIPLSVAQWVLMIASLS